jgi:hypothetical protein
VNFTGLSLDQAPPIGVPLRFFLTAPLFAFLAALLFMVQGSPSFVRYDSYVIATTHLITIGFFGFVMLGALTQMLPVIANATIKNVSLITTLAYYSIVFGIFSMVFAFVLGKSLLFVGAYLGLGFGFLVMLGAILHSILRVENITPTIKAMIHSLVFGVVIVSLGVFLLTQYAHNSLDQLHIRVADIHATFAIFGFAMMLVVGVGFQVLPMFYVATNFAKYFENNFGYFVVAGLFAWGVGNLFFQEILSVVKWYLSGVFFYYIYLFIIRLQTRKRKINDITILYFKTAMVFLFVGLMLWSLSGLIFEDVEGEMALFVGGFVFFMILGMLHKIIPFLVWFHLNAKGYMSIPTMNEMIPKKRIYTQYFLTLGSVVLFIVAHHLTIVFYPSLVIFMVSMVLLEWNLCTPYIIYRKTLQKKPDFDMDAFMVS